MGRHMPNWRKESSARVYARYARGICFFFSESLWVSVVKNFPGHFLLGIFIQESLPVNLQQEVRLSLSYSQEGNEKLPVPLIKVYIQKYTCRLLLLITYRREHLEV